MTRTRAEIIADLNAVAARVLNPGGLPPDEQHEIARQINEVAAELANPLDWWMPVEVPSAVVFADLPVGVGGGSGAGGARTSVPATGEVNEPAVSPLEALGADGSLTDTISAVDQRGTFGSDASFEAGREPWRPLDEQSLAAEARDRLGLNQT